MLPEVNNEESSGNNVETPEPAAEPTAFAGEAAGGESTEASEPAEAPAEQTEAPAEAPATKAPVTFADFAKARNDTPQVQPAVTPEKPKAPARDYSMFDEADRPILQKMGNEAFAKVQQIYTENKQLKETVTKAPKSQQFYGHPQAYALTPEFQQVNYNLSLSNQIENHWVEQLTAVEMGQPWRDIELDPKTGQLALGQPQPVTVETMVRIKADLNKNLRFAQNQTMGFQSKINSFAADYTKSYNGAVGAIKAIEEKFFPGFDAKDHKTRKLQDDIVAGLPPEFRDGPTASLIGKLGAALSTLLDENNKLKAGQQTKAAIKVDASKAPPTKSKFVTGSSNGHRTVSYSDYAKIREQA